MKEGHAAAQFSSPSSASRRFTAIRHSCARPNASRQRSAREEVQARTGTPGTLVVIPRQANITSPRTDPAFPVPDPPGAVSIDAPAKINLALHAVGKRADGYHLLESLVVFTRFGDRLTISKGIPMRFPSTGRLPTACRWMRPIWCCGQGMRCGSEWAAPPPPPSAVPVPHCRQGGSAAATFAPPLRSGGEGPPKAGEGTSSGASHLWETESHGQGYLPPPPRFDPLAAQADLIDPPHKWDGKGCAAIRLTKNLPIASGIGGGSSDAAAALKGLNDIWTLGLDRAQLADIALALGADLPMCLAARPLVARGIGEIIDPTPDFPDLHLVLVNPAVAVSTPQVFEGLSRSGNPPLPPLPTPLDLTALVCWLAATRNDLEAPALSLAPRDRRGAGGTCGAIRRFRPHVGIRRDLFRLVRNARPSQAGRRHHSSSAARLVRCRDAHQPLSETVTVKTTAAPSSQSALPC